MKTSRDPVHDSLVASYQTLEAIKLNESLRSNGIQDRELRRKIISDYLFSQGVVLDQMWFMEDGTKYYPGVYFADKPHDQIAEATIYLPSPEYGMNFHEYALGAADWAIENNEGNGEEIETGNEQ